MILYDIICIYVYYMHMYLYIYCIYIYNYICTNPWRVDNVLPMQSVSRVNRDALWLQLYLVYGRPQQKGVTGNFESLRSNDIEDSPSETLIYSWIARPFAGIRYDLRKGLVYNMILIHYDLIWSNIYMIIIWS
jgi:hypothetical protein